MGTVIVQILAGMKLWLLIVGTVLVYITVENEARSIKGDLVEDNPASLVGHQAALTRVRRAVYGKGKNKHGKGNGKGKGRKGSRKKGKGGQKKGRKFNPWGGPMKPVGPPIKPPSRNRRRN